MMRLPSFCIAAATLVPAVSVCHHDDKSRSSPLPPITSFGADFARTTHDIVYVSAKDFRGLGYGLAYADAQDQVWMSVDSLLKARGKRSQCFGPDADATQRVGDEYAAASGVMELSAKDGNCFFKSCLAIDQRRAGYAAGSAEPSDLHGDVAGYDRYLKDYAGKSLGACNDVTWLRSIGVDEMALVGDENALQASGEVFAREVAAARDAGVAGPAVVRAPARRVDAAFLLARLATVHRRGFGSNGLAVREKPPVSKHRLLLSNPHDR